MREGDPAVAAPVRGETDQAITDPELVAARLGRVDHLGLGDGSGSGLELVGPSEVLDQLPRRVRLAGVAVIGEAAAVSRGELPRIALAQVREAR